MTYNFDPDRWYERERAAIERRRVSGELDDRQFEEALEDLESRLEAMLARLDGTFQIPG